MKASGGNGPRWACPNTIAATVNAITAAIHPARSSRAAELEEASEPRRSIGRARRRPAEGLGMSRSTESTRSASSVLWERARPKARTTPY